MTLIFGGAYQGKLTFTLEKFGLGDGDVYRCCNDGVRMPEGKRIIYELEKWLLALVRAGIGTDEAAQRFTESNADAIVICNDISCGVVPAEPELREWREAVGRALALLARNSDEVYRLFCGMPTKIK